MTILAIFNLYKVEPKLYTIIFGESILNDAIAIVLFETAQRYKEGSAAGNLTFMTLFEAIGIFLLVFLGSLVIGIAVGIGTALALKYILVRRFPKIESCLIILIAYASYFFSMASTCLVKFSVLAIKVEWLTADPRHRFSSILWYHPEALCILQHVTPNTADNEIPVPSACSAIREFHLHLPRLDALYGNGPRF